MPRPRPLSAIPGTVWAANHRAEVWYHGMVWRPHTAGATRNHAVHVGRFRPGHGNQNDGAAHAFAEEVERYAWMALPQHPHRRLQVVAQGFDAGPMAAIDRLAEAPLVVRVGRHAAVSEIGAGGVEEVAIVVEPVERQDHRRGRAAFGSPGAERQGRAVGRDDLIAADAGRDRRRAARLDHRRAAHQNHQRRY